MATNAVVNVAAGGVEATSDWMDKLQTIGVEYGMKIMGALAVLIIGMWVAKAIQKGLVKLLEKKGLDPTLISFLSPLAHVAVQVFVIVAALGVLDIPTASFVAVLGAAGLAVGLALQGSLSNYASGV